MGISIIQYRAAIGLFNRVKFILSGIIFGCSLVHLLICYVLLCLLLLQAGDIELNPGPIAHSSLKNLRICHVNIRGLNDTKLRALKTSLCNDYDIITISETFLSENSNVDLSISGFHGILRRDRSTFGGGVAIYI